MTVQLASVPWRWPLVLRRGAAERGGGALRPDLSVRSRDANQENKDKAEPSVKSPEVKGAFVWPVCPAQVLAL